MHCAWLINLVGGVLTLLLLSWLAFRPEQGLAHNAVHAVYTICQLPLIVVATRELTRMRGTGAA